MSSPEYIDPAELQPGNKLYSATYGPCEVLAFHAQDACLQLLALYTGQNVALTAAALPSLQLFDGRAVGKPPARWVPPMQAASAVCIYELLVEATDTGSGVWPILRLRDDLEPDAVHDLLQKLTPLMLYPQGHRTRAPHLCSFNVHAMKFVVPSTLVAVQGAMLGVAIRVAKAVETPAPMAVLPHSFDGYQNIFQVLSVQVQPNQLEGTVRLLHSNGLVLSAYMLMFNEQAPYLQADTWYEFLLRGVGFNVKPARTGPLKVPKPDWLDELNRVVPDAGVVLNELGGLTLDVSQTTVLIPVKGFGEPVFEFQGRIRLVTAKTWEPELASLYGARGYVLDVIVAEGSDEHLELVMRLVVTSRHIADGWLPQKGQMVQGYCWLSAYLTGRVPQPKIKTTLDA